MNECRPAVTLGRQSASFKCREPVFLVFDLVCTAEGLGNI